MLGPGSSGSGALAAVVLAALALTAAHSTARTQDAPQRPPPFRAGVTLVNVDAYPRRGGRVVEGLRPQDFQILEDGKPQTIETFEFIRIAPNPPDADRRDPGTKEEGDELAADPHNRVFVVYLDAFHTTRAGAHDIREPLLVFLSRTIGAQDLFGVLTPQVPVRQLVFGRSLDTLRAELTKHFDWGLRDREISPLDGPPMEARLATCMTASAPSLGDALVALYREEMLADSLEELMTRLSALRDGRKNILFISEGWRPLAPQPAFANLVSGTVPPIAVGPGGRLGMNPQRDLQDRSWCDQQIARLSSIDFERRFRDLLEHARRANVAFYPVDVGRLGGSVAVSRPRGPLLPTPQERLAAAVVQDVFATSVDTLRILADNTDGRAIFNTNDLGAGLRRISDDLSAYYLLGYSSTNPAADGRYRRIEVKVTQPDVSVTARRGYLAPAPESRAIAASAAAAVAVPASVASELGRLARLRPDTELFAYAARSASDVTVVAELASRMLASGRWNEGAEARVAIANAGAEALAATAKLEPGARGVLVRLPLPGAAAPARVTVTLSGAAGTIEVPVEVGQAPADALVGDAVCLRGTPAPRVPMRPVADFQFRRSERMHVEWPALVPIDQRTVRLLDRRGQPLPLTVALTEQPGSASSPILAADLTLAPLAEGDYLVELTVGASGRTEQRLLAFRVVR